MSRAGVGVRRPWVVFSGLCFLLCGVSLFVLLGPHREPASSLGAPASDPAPPPPAMISSSPRVEPATRVPEPAKNPPTGTLARPDIHKETSVAASEGSLPRKSDIKGGKTKKLPQDGERDNRLPAAASEHADGDGGGEKKLGGAGSGAQQPAAHGMGPPVAPSAVSEPLAASVLKVNAPPKMIVGQAEHIRAVIGSKANAEMVAQEVALGAEDGHPQVQLSRNLMLSKLVRMELRSDVAGDFEINPRHTSPELRLLEDDVTTWEWAVVPKVEGRHRLTLTVSNLKEPTRELMQTKIYPVNIEVQVTAFQRVRELAVAGSSVLSALAGLLGAWLGILRPLTQRRRSEGDGDPGSARPRGAGSAPPGPNANPTPRLPPAPAPDPAPAPTPAPTSAHADTSASPDREAPGPEHRFTD